MPWNCFSMAMGHRTEYYFGLLLVVISRERIFVIFHNLYKDQDSFPREYYAVKDCIGPFRRVLKYLEFVSSAVHRTTIYKYVQSLESLPHSQGSQKYVYKP